MKFRTRVLLGIAATAALASAWQRESLLLVPRIAAIDRYLKSLADGVRRAVLKNGDAAGELEAVADAWEVMTDEVGRAAQRDAYRRQLHGGHQR